MSWAATMFQKGAAFFRWVVTLETLERESPAGPVPSPGRRSLLKWLLEREELGREEPAPAGPGTGPILHLLRRDVLAQEDAALKPAGDSFFRRLVSTEELGREEEAPGGGPRSLLAWLISRDRLETPDQETPAAEPPPN